MYRSKAENVVLQELKDSGFPFVFRQTIPSKTATADLIACVDGQIIEFDARVSEMDMLKQFGKI